MIKEIDEWLAEIEYEEIRKKIQKQLEERREEYLVKEELGIDLIRV